MEFYDSAKQSMDIEKMLLEVLDEHSICKTPDEVRQFMEPGENIYKIKIEVEQIWPPL